MVNYCNARMFNYVLEDLIFLKEKRHCSSRNYIVPDNLIYYVNFFGHRQLKLTQRVK